MTIQEMARRKFLYISPYFPPQSRVGALRPLKFVRHLPNNGWLPVVLADLSCTDEISEELERAVPKNVEVVRNYSKYAKGAEARYFAGKLTTRPVRKRDLKGNIRNMLQAIVAQQAGGKHNLLRSFIPGPEFVPLGRHFFDIGHAIKASRELLRRGCFKAVVVNADPWAALLVGARVSKEFDIPLILDLRDPWSVCDVRRKMRLRLQLKMNDNLERRAVGVASKVILNTQTATDAYRLHYKDLPADRFTVIRNHGDIQLTSSGRYHPPEVFTMLYLGRFRRFVEGYQLFRALKELKARGYDGARVQLMITGHVLHDAKSLAKDLDIDDMLVYHPFVAYTEVGSFIKTMDLLITLSSSSKLRIPSKFYDYAVSQRPILSISDNEEIQQICRVFCIDGIYNCALNDISGIADVMEKVIGKGRRCTIRRPTHDLDSATASAALASILDEVSAK